MTLDLAGITVALLTPLDENGAVDEASLQRLVRRVVDGGVVGIGPTGSTGEGARLPRDQRVETTRLVRELAPDVPVVSGVPLSSVAEGADELDRLAENGATAALVAPPHYYPAADAELVHLYTWLADRSPLPLLLYNIPMFTKVSFSPAVVAELAAHPGIVGIKDSSRDVDYFQRLLAATDGLGFTVLTGSDTFLLAALLAGATGAIAASANLVPELSTGLVAAHARGDVAEASRLQQRLSAVIYACRAGTLPAGWKAALSHLGVIQPYLAAPAQPLDPARRDRLVTALTELGVG